MKNDMQLQQDVIAELNWDPSINATHVGVSASDGAVTLTGHVSSYAEKWAAERAALRVAGVKALAIEMDVQLPNADRRDDADISRSVANLLQQMAEIPKEGLQVMVEKGWVTLSGTVEWDYQRQIATRMVRHLLGVTGVSDNIAIRPKLSMNEVKGGVENALRRRAIADMDSISVTIQGADVILNGSVHSWSERELADHAAWGMPGVHQVINRIKVVI
ncbi:BON domain-containing protein [Chromobacterium subtsugae]|uniref:BON domain-containing protein n=1 Tax=Chromobacterium subtsugae TaxID=251747 RepID=A0ABS7FIW2_9NEIS|nr:MULTISPECIES: BON domain-containing protein [Chromobacterium]KUM04987.1 OsmY domain-containing protein [Chromobacterium subtsugae]KZE86382.1 OsmY domain-containing protein [Chromobacterium sp. F49]MBW7568012.1 BON domain-containing protein [Chromobacterium subtsugae]MBW8289239.1 BON domain-containing protein [Chromobacterium subtsugae]WSE92722.1 BON domain-containing protein [Chromobacterium subtsugae]